MSRKAARFTEADLNRAAKVAKKLGMDAVVDQDGSIRVTAARPVDNPPAPVEGRSPRVF